MKKIIPLFLITILFAACANEGLDAPKYDTSSTSGKRSEAEAISIAQNLADARTADSRICITPEVASVNIIGSSLSRGNADTLIYVVNYADNDGYALISAAKSGDAIIGYTDAGTFDADEAAANPVFSYYLEAALDYVSTQSKIMPIDPIPNPGAPISITKSVFPTLATEWGQRYPEGLFCPNGISGCVQTATAQIMAFFEQPTSINLTYPDRSAELINLNWDNIKLHKKSSNTLSEYEAKRMLCKGNESSHIALAHLCRELGHLNNASYNNYSTIANSYYNYILFKSMLPNLSFTDYNSFNSSYSNLFEELSSKSGSIAYVRGRDLNESAGHAWVCDGGDYVKTTSSALDYKGQTITVVEETYYYHFNWGWCGQDNGYFLAGVFDNNKPASRYSFTSSLNFFVVSK
ncbi:MAG: C10 family peptidase [Muribaculaceae bacterium]|nr:C10 family peptidase [Muribaculaceae bacterium]